jgi:hypothetical protein
MRLICEMAHELYSALKHRQRCTACCGDGLVYSLQPTDPDDPECYGDDLPVTSPCGCSTHSDIILKRFEEEFKLLREIAQEQHETKQSQQRKRA